MMNFQRILAYVLAKISPNSGVCMSILAENCRRNFSKEKLVSAKVSRCESIIV